MIESRKMRWAGYVARMGAEFTRHSEGKGPEGKPNYRFEDSIKTDLRKNDGKCGLD
jgi:hypothetical protein